MTLKAAFIFVSEQADPAKHRSHVNTGDVEVTTIAVKTTHKLKPLQNHCSTKASLPLNCVPGLVLKVWLASSRL